VPADEEAADDSLAQPGTVKLVECQNKLEEVPTSFKVVFGVVLISISVAAAVSPQP